MRRRRVYAPQGANGIRRSRGSFAADMQTRQIAWARTIGIPSSAFEPQWAWVLKRSEMSRNFFRSKWGEYIKRKEHTWARSLNSSQCFAVNLFGPLREDPARARQVLRRLLPHHDLHDSTTTVTVEFEYQPVGADAWLGETGGRAPRSEHSQPTQIDVYFRVNSPQQGLGHVCVEVKFTEHAFGSCRGWANSQRVPKAGDPPRNPDRDRCRDAASIVAAPADRCWMAQAHGRRYWDLMGKTGSSLSLDVIHRIGACPFRYGLYQLMRNRLLADELLRHTGAAWSEFAVCRHPRNVGVNILQDPVGQLSDALEAFRHLCAPGAVLDWDAQTLASIVAETDPQLEQWRVWMNQRYFAIE
jgi:hypothetical protein